MLELLDRPMSRDEMQRNFEEAYKDKQAAEGRVRSWWQKVNKLPTPFREVAAVVTSPVPAIALVDRFFLNIKIANLRNRIVYIDRAAGS